MHFIICDDNTGFAGQLRARIMRKSPSYTADVAGNIAELMTLMSSSAEAVSAVFMDISLADGNGITAAAKLHKQYPSVRIVYITGYDGFSQSVFECPVGAEPIAFLKKPVEERYLDNALSKLLETPAEKEVRYVEIKRKGAVSYIPREEIIAAYSSRRKVIVHTVNSDIEFYGKLSDFADKLRDEFVQCHKSYVVNISHLRRIDNWNAVEMSDGFYCPVSRRYVQELKTRVVEIRGDAK